MLQRFDQVFEEIKASRFEDTGGKTLSEHLRVDYGAYTTWLYNIAEGATSASNVELWQWDTKVWVEAKTAGHTFYGRARFRYRSFNQGGNGDGFTYPLVDRYWYRYDWRKDRRARTGQDTNWNWWVQVGRQYVNWAQGITLSQPTYAARIGAQVGLWKLDAVIAQTPDEFVDFDASRPGSGAATDRFFWGAILSYFGLKNHRPYVYYLNQTDNNEATLPGGATWLYDSWYTAVGSTGQIATGAWLYRFEFIHEGGRSASDVLGSFPQTIDDISAWAGRLYFAYMPQAQRYKHGLRFEFELLIGSGDSDRGQSAQTVGGNLSGTKDNAFNAFGYVYTGYVLAPDLSNLVSLRLTASAVPWRGVRLLKRMRMKLDVFFLSRLDSNAPVSVATVPGESYLGTEFDFTLDWIITNDLNLDVRYGILFPGDGLPFNGYRQFLFLGFSYGF